ncbi:hypothetical protein HYH02_001653 [Chlamydomonas schloesseri]|uniref:Protein kinase domain-containing protein n=1 Tax=Chlamydomonas schloesseri TaxID=2026947 RepID=A0A835WTG9_9CHLO|nr:hypothetical protein HYH02_001653 [Chlamydomonas schloesseri]|eukprot:KAG2453430.1 hypothetical protein HYH02_001653 [Chlamydomonas schloesseri]
MAARPRASGLKEPGLVPAGEPGTYYVGLHETWQVGKRYELMKVLGTGSFSSVCLAVDTLDNEKVALKRVGDVFASLENAKRVLREVCIMRRLEHPNIVRLKDVFLRPSPTGKYVFRGGKLVPTSFDCYLAMDYCDQGDMFNMRGQLPEHEVRSLMLQLLGALRYLHGLNVWHRDIKTGNLLLSLAEGRRLLKVADFGSARSAVGPAPREPPAAAAVDGAVAPEDCDCAVVDGDQQSGRGGGLQRQSSKSDMEVEDHCEPDSDTGTSPEGGPQSLEAAAAAQASRGDGTGARRSRDRAGSMPPRPRGRNGDEGAGRGMEAAGSAGLVAVPAPDGGYNPPLTSVVCTPCYRAPEVVMSRGGYSSAIDMWGAGCVFGELLQRAALLGRAATPHLQVAPVFAITAGRPMTPHTGMRYGVAEPGHGLGASAYAELTALFAVIGTPAWACIESVPSAAWRRYLFHIPGKAPTLYRRFGGAGEVAVDLLSRLLQFDPARRASAEEAMAHEYFALLHVEAQMAATELATAPRNAAHRAGGAAGSFRRSPSPAVEPAAAKAPGAPNMPQHLLPSWPPVRSSPSQRNSGTGFTVPAEGAFCASQAVAVIASMEVPAPAAAFVAQPHQQVQQLEQQLASAAGGLPLPADAVQPLQRLPSVTLHIRRNNNTSAGGVSIGSASCPSKRKLEHEHAEAEGHGEGGDARMRSRSGSEERQVAAAAQQPEQEQRQQPAVAVPAVEATPSREMTEPPEKMRFWQIDDPGLALATLEEELAALVPPLDTPATSSAAREQAYGGSGRGGSVLTDEELAFVEKCKEQLRLMLERECEEHGARAALARLNATDERRASAGGGGGAGSAAGGSGNAGGFFVRRNNSDGMLDVVGGGSMANVQHGHLRPDPGQSLDPAVIAQERVPYHADAAAGAALEPERHLWAGRHGEWTSSSLAEGRRKQQADEGVGSGTWGVTLMPPGLRLDEHTAEGQAYIKAVRGQHAR